MSDVIQLPRARKAPRPSGARPDVQDLYHPVEHAILRHYLGLAPLDFDDPGLFAVELAADRDEDDPREDPCAAIRLQRGLEPQLAVENAVARICLNAIQGRLPQWGVCREDGAVLFARRYERRRGAPAELKPVFLFEINWADSGPGFSWPEAYHATFLPGYGRWVVTASVDSPDVRGCTEWAIGHFAGHRKLARACRELIVSQWREAPGGDPETGWAYLFSEGYVLSRTAYLWRRAAWPAARVPRDASEYFVD